MVYKTQTGSQVAYGRKKIQNPSVHQEKIFDEIHSGGGNLVVIAGPGCGKTTTSVEALYYTPEWASTVYMAFNRAIADEIRTRVPEGGEVYTYHSFGMRALIRSFPHRVHVDKEKLEKILRKILPSERYHWLVGSVTRLVKFAKNNLLSEPEEILDMAEHHGMNVKNPERWISNIRQYVIPALKVCKEEVKTIDFDDMCWLPLVRDDVDVPEFDFIFVDEVQDTNRTQSGLVEMAMGPETRLIAVGDPRQSINGFRGADSAAIPKLIDKFDAQILSLPVTYRCPRSHVAFLKKFIPELEAAPDAIEGTIEYPRYADVPFLLEKNDLVMSRTMSTLVDCFLKTIALNKRAVIRGKDLGKELIRMVDYLEPTGIQDLLEKLKQYCNDEVEKYLNRGKPDLAQKVWDDTETVYALSQGVRDLDSLIARIRNTFSDRIDGIVFSTVHRAKGLEEYRTWILRPDLMPHPTAELEWEKEQEENIQAVAYSRSKEYMYIVQPPYPAPRMNFLKGKGQDKGAALNEEHDPDTHELFASKNTEEK